MINIKIDNKEYERNSQKRIKKYFIFLRVMLYYIIGEDYEYKA